jgi:amidase
MIPFPLLGWPAVAVPMRLDGHGVPIGVQPAAPPGREARLLAIATQLEALRPPLTPSPGAG